MSLRTSFCVAALLLFMGGALAELSPSYDSAKGMFRLRYESQLQPLAINRIHSWRVRIETTGGEPVPDAALTINGGMPAHDHGLPTAPRVTRQLGEGEYLIEGMRFHMGGYWEIHIEIRAADRSDTVTVPLEL